MSLRLFLSLRFPPNKNGFCSQRRVKVFKNLPRTFFNGSLCLQQSVETPASGGEFVRKGGIKEQNLGKIVDLSFEKENLRERKPSSESSEDKEPKINFTKLSGKSSILPNFMVNVKSRSKREKSGTIVLEGKRLIEDALAAELKPKALFFSRVSDVEGFKLDPDVQLYQVPYKSLELWSDLSTCQGVLGIFPVPDTTKHVSSCRLDVSIVCDNVRDPGNMGSILRTAAAVGASQLLLTKGCVDVWESKVLRSAAGAHFRLCIYTSLSWDDVTDLAPPSSSVYLADSHVPPESEDEPYPPVYELSPTGEKVPVTGEEQRLTAYQNHPLTNLPLIPYTETNYRTPLLLIVGGETQGLSEEALQLGAEKSGTRVYIPLENGVESLNSGTALGVLIYEIRRQKFSAREKL